MKMTRTRLVRGGFGLVAIAALLVPALVQAQGSPLPQVRQDSNQNRTLYATTSDNRLLTFSARFPQSAMSKQITGLPTGVTLVGIDTRPASGEIYGVGSDSKIYRVNPMTAIAVPESTSPFNPALSGRFFGVDFNPTVDRIRVVSDFDQNLALHPDDGTAVANTNLNPGEPSVVGSAYTNSSFTAFNGPNKATSTILYALDAGDDTLCVQNPPANGTLVNCKELSINVRNNAGFEIVGHKGATTDTNVGYVATRDPLTSGSALWRLDLGNAETELHGPIRVNLEPQTVTGLAALQDQR
jgi:hypothetical protein